MCCCFAHAVPSRCEEFFFREGASLGAAGLVSTSFHMLACSLLVASLPVSRRSLLAVAGSTGIRPPLQPVSPWLGPAEATLAGSSVFWVRPGSQPSSPSLVKYEPQMALDVLSAAPSRGGALFVGEHHDSASDHVLQARRFLDATSGLQTALCLLLHA